MATVHRIQKERSRSKGHKEKGQARAHSNASQGVSLDEVKKFIQSRRNQKSMMPLLAATTLGGVGVALAMSVGVGELTFGAAVAYAAYRMLRGQRPLSAIQEEMKLSRAA